MNVSHARVHAVVEDTPNNGGDNANAPPRVRMKEIQGMAGTPGGLSLRLLQFVLAAAALLLMATIIDFPSVTAFRCLVAAAGLQSLWSLSLAITDAYAILVMRSLQNYRLVSFFTAGDWVTSTLTFGAACACAGITVDAGRCSQLHCETAIQMAFTCWFTTVPSFFLSFWSLAYR